MAWNPMDLNLDGKVDFTDYMLFNTFINPNPSNSIPGNGFPLHQLFETDTDADDLFEDD